MGALAILFLLFEICDMVLNPSTSFKELVFGYARRWAKSKAFFLLTQFNFIFLTFCVFGLNLQSTIIIFLYLFYALDSAYKIYLSDKIVKDELNDELKMLLNGDIRITLWQRALLSLGVALLFFMGVV
ncbi:hypothetical protein [Campylobacter geochelonis]|uniref:hypothetical protein n=1 Tax=Campylobacter geochelonis TaxID=1780362 RepID=UPI000770A94A|nr:hypothetical protein [Campylobacter geochelonis]CZE47121.1 Uncharacterised protein [Campylobacter geochelonis]CZE51016.1 Uncharacterised protein [Campylobacter geochelonis]